MSGVRNGAWRFAGAYAVLLLVSIGPRQAAFAITYTWTADGAADHRWSNGANWGGVGPASNETEVELVFPALDGPYASDNDLSALQVVSIAITTQLGDGDYLFTGNSVTLAGPATMDSPGAGNPNLVWRIPIALGADVTVSTSGRQTQLQGTFDLGSNTLTLAAAGDIALSGVVSGGGNLTKNGTSALTMSGANTYTGDTTSNGGALYISHPMALGNSTRGTTFSGGFLGFSPGSAFTTAEPFVFNGGKILAYGTPTMTGSVRLNATIEIEAFQPVSVLTMNGSIDGAGGVSKIGPGLVILSSPSNSYSGSTAAAEGTLQLDGALSSTNPVTVENGATLRGNGSTNGTIDVRAGGILAPGDSPGEISSSGLMLASGATLAAEIDGPNPAAQYDTLDVAGPVSLGGATLSLALGYVPAAGERFTLISHADSRAVNGIFAALEEGTTFDVGGTTFGITYTGGSGRDVVLVAAPTPTPTGTPTEPPRTATATPSADSTATATPSRTASSVAATATSTPTTTASATVTRTVASGCEGDCDGNGTVSVSELVLAVALTLDEVESDRCPQLSGGASPTVASVIGAVRNALSGCP